MSEEHPDLAAARRTSTEQASRIRAMTASVVKEHAAFRKETARDRADREESARAGALGRDAQRLQERIDAGETTMADVVSGRDDHPSAILARQHLERGLEPVRSLVEADPETIAAQAEADQRTEEIRRAGDLS